MAIFELTGGTTNQQLPDMLGIWQPAPPTPMSTSMGDGVSFGSLSSEANIPALPTWRVRLPAEVEQAHALLATGEQQVATAYRNLPVARQRVETIAQLAEGGTEQPVSFAAPTLADDEQEMLALLRVGEGSSRGESAPVSFGGAETIAPDEDTIQQATGFFEQVRQMISSYTLVETEVGNKLLARTSVSWGGDYRTVWSRACTPEQMQLHTRTLRLSTTSRDAFVLIFQETIRLLFLVSTPAGALLAIPSAWRLINRIMQQGDLTYGK